MKRLCAVMVLACAATCAWAGVPDAGEGSEDTQDAAAAAYEPVLVPVFSVVDDIFQADESQHSGDDWLALRCIETGCTLVPASLKVKARVVPRKSGEALRGQQLTFRTTSGTGVVLAWLQIHADLPWLKAGPVPTYASTVRLPDHPPTRGSFEWAIALPDGKRALLVPIEGSPPTLQLRASGKRQFLGELGRCGKDLSLDYFRWAGDLDGDGQPDYLIATLSGPSSARLHLSSAAMNDSLVDDFLGRSLATAADQNCESSED